MPFSIFNFFFNRKLIFSRDLMNHCTKYQQRIQKLFFLTKSRFLYIFLPPVKNFFFFHVLWPRWTIVPEVFAPLNLKHKPPPPTGTHPLLPFNDIPFSVSHYPVSEYLIEMLLLVLIFFLSVQLPRYFLECAL